MSCDDERENENSEHWMQGKRDGRVDGLKEATVYLLRIAGEQFVAGNDRDAKFVRSLADNLTLIAKEADTEARRLRK